MAGASPRQGTIHARPGKISRVTPAGVKSHQGKDPYQRSVCPRGREFYASRQGKAELSRRQSCFDGRVYGYWCVCWLSWDSCSGETGPREDSWLGSAAREPRKQHETEVMQQARQRHVSGSALIEGGCWMTSVSADPLVVHATARLAVVRFMQRRDCSKGRIMDRFSRRATQAIRGRDISRQAALVEESRNCRGS